MRSCFGLLLGVTLVLTLLSGVDGGEKGKEVIIKGQIACAKCALAIEKSCATVVVEKKDKKDVIYYFDAESHKKFHEDICSESKDGTVTGIVTTKGTKNFIAVKKLEYKK
jgi:Family of unknown function (DUF6370)